MHFFRCKGLADPNINVVLNSKALLVSMNAILVEDITVTSDEKVFIHQVKKDKNLLNKSSLMR